jgi:hypothetical protein
MSSPTQTLESWVRNPLEAWMSVRVYSMFVLSCVQVAALRQADHPSVESYCLSISSRLILMGNGPEGLIRKSKEGREEEELLKSIFRLK